MGEVFGYARVSTADQDASLQRDALSRYGCSEISPMWGPGRGRTARSSTGYGETAGR